MKPRHYIIIGLLFLTIILMWVDKISITHNQRDAETFWETRSQEKTSLLNWYEERLVEFEKKELEVKVADNGDATHP